MGSLTQLAAKEKLLMLLHEDYERSFHRIFPSYSILGFGEIHTPQIFSLVDSQVR